MGSQGQRSFRFGGQHDDYDCAIERIPSVLLSPELRNVDCLGSAVLVLA